MCSSSFAKVLHLIADFVKYLASPAQVPLPGGKTSACVDAYGTLRATLHIVCLLRYAARLRQAGPHRASRQKGMRNAG